MVCFCAKGQAWSAQVVCRKKTGARGVGLGCDAMLGQTEHGGGGRVRTRMSTAASSGGSSGDSGRGRRGAGFGVVCAR